jgi:hypothetical protein
VVELVHDDVVEGVAREALQVSDAAERLDRREKDLGAGRCNPRARGGRTASDRLSVTESKRPGPSISSPRWLLRPVIPVHRFRRLLCRRRREA